MEKTDKTQAENVISELIDYEIRGCLIKWLSPIRLFPKYAAMYYTWKAKAKMKRWLKSRGEA